MKKGLIEVYTGDGKGKTTSAIGLALRAKSHKLNVCFIYFHKNLKKWNYKEVEILKKNGIDVFTFAKKHPFCEKTDIEKLRKECLEGLEFIKKIFNEKKYDVVICDEILISLRDGFLKEKEIIDIMEEKPKNIELILTGRGATKKIIKKADYVSEIKKIKHPYDKGIKARKGIEY
ncbi:MAG: cob(I)yrinic acid a,c-diamide adenosyltransferase [bacterium]|nr:cob(I)yrinic acid a,c-diamide adenosyltransferase [bacterium]MCX7917182.1 cob(I)yrinic acid a,c-diamide adenosyltransferase [bacterium]MDW8164492.1 cob(I)yrinic acid a,c-diamide adenosyltransferase [Candidatus Omnitrophota bacterium]